MQTLLNRLKVAKRNDGVWISKYLKIIPMNKATLLVTVQPFQQKSKQSQHKMAIVLDISEWQGKLNGFAS